MDNSAKTMDKIVALCKNRGFIFPGSEIYGGLANSWDYGPLGVEFKNNVKRAWWKKFVQENKNVLDEYYRFKQTEEYLKSPGYRLMTLMKEFCGTSGYYDVFIPAMRRLSHQYNEYYEQLLRANEEFVKNHPEYLG